MSANNRERYIANNREIYTANFDSNQFVVGGGVAIFHLATSRVVICSCMIKGRKLYFLPKGRRDAGEESGTGAEREGYEEVCKMNDNK
jgi:8-oxo-dGTP pyrophosphatase MutT (NUDIX family)